jgi:hypothetical protein
MNANQQRLNGLALPTSSPICLQVRWLADILAGLKGCPNLVWESSGMLSGTAHARSCCRALFRLSVMRSTT